jgi:hypothetical protein
MVSDHKLRSWLCLDLASQTNDTELSRNLLAEVDQLSEAIAQCDDNCSHESCNAGRHLRKLSLKRLAVTVQKSEEEAAYAVQLMGEPEYYFPDEQIDMYLQLYKQTGNNTARKYFLDLLNDASYYRSDLLSGQLKEVAEADLCWNNTLSSPEIDNEVVPLVAWEIEKVYWGIDKYLREALGEDTSDMSFGTTFDQHIPTEEEAEAMHLLGMRTDDEETTIFGPLSASFNDPDALQRDLENCQRQRDAAFTTLSTLLAARGSHNAANYFLRKVDSQEEKVRGLVALAQIFSQ